MNDKVLSYFDISADDPRWLDWKWQYANRITDVESLAKIINLSEKDQQGIASCLQSFRMAITPYFASLLDPDDPFCPLRRQSVPSLDELAFHAAEGEDPLNEEGDSPSEDLVHRYPDRALFLVTRHCAMYCRFCVRKRLVGEEDFVINTMEKNKALSYIADTPAIRDVLISGGDPLTIVDDELEDIVSSLRSIPHVEIIRIGTRVPAVLPMRITADLLNMLKKYQPIWVNVHFNHPRELTELAVKACTDIVDAGIPVGNQSVLLKGVNDDPTVMRELLYKLVKARVRPYYLYQCDLIRGTSHFRTKVQTGIDIIHALTGNITGFAVPKYVIDAPQGGGKVPINPEYVVSMDDERVVMTNYEGKTYTYPQTP
ncbi:MAG: KamA family radical SAM protein [Coriobacteriia bacterium]|nr:KamA family radical SAM protein [Coriobacteriia bacterium]